MAEVTLPKGGSTIKGSITPTKLVPSHKVTNEGEYSLEDVDPIGRTEAMFVGPPGSGKSVLAATLPPPFRWLDADRGLKSLRWAYLEGKTSLTSLGKDQIVAYSPMEALEKGYAKKPNAFNDMLDRIDFWFSDGEREKWEGGTLVIDSFSEVNDWALNLGLSLNGQYPSPDKPLSTSARINASAMVKLVVGEQDYKSAMGLIQKAVSEIRSMCARYDRNLVLICHEWTEQRERDDGTMTVVRYRPALIGQLRDKLSKDFDDVWFMQVYNGKDYKVQLHQDATRTAKTRFGGMVSREEPADYRLILEKVREYHNDPIAFRKKYEKK